MRDEFYVIKHLNPKPWYFLVNEYPEKCVLYRSKNFRKVLEKYDDAMDNLIKCEYPAIYVSNRKDLKKEFDFYKYAEVLTSCYTHLDEDELAYIRRLWRKRMRELKRREVRKVHRV